MEVIFLAKKFIFNNFPAYHEGPFAVLKRDDIDGLWRVYHIETQQRVMGGKIKGCKQKKEALTYAFRLCNTSINWNFKSSEEMYKLNSESDLIDQIFPLIKSLTQEN